MKRNYLNHLEFVEKAFTACWHNAADLVKCAKLLLDNSLHAQSLSLSVLALEELGKLLCVDGLLFARPEDHKAEAFTRSLKSHSAKLSAFELFPLLLGQLAKADPRCETDSRFARAVVISLRDLNEKGNKVLSMLGTGTFHELDKWKQSGFYSQPRGNSFLNPSQAVSPELAQTVYELAWRALSTVDFLLMSGNLERYIEFARTIRSELKEDEHTQLEELGKRMVGALFPVDEGNNVELKTN